MCRSISIRSATGRYRPATYGSLPGSATETASLCICVNAGVSAMGYFTVVEVSVSESRGNQIGLMACEIRP